MREGVVCRQLPPLRRRGWSYETNLRQTGWKAFRTDTAPEFQVSSRFQLKTQNDQAILQIPAMKSARGGSANYLPKTKNESVELCQHRGHAPNHEAR